MLKSAHSRTQQRWYATGKRVVLTAVLLLVAVLLSAYVQDTDAPATSQVAAAPAMTSDPIQTAVALPARPPEDPPEPVEGLDAGSIGGHGQSFPAGPASHVFLECYTDMATDVFDVNDNCLRLRIYLSDPSYISDVLWYWRNPEGQYVQTPACTGGGCVVVLYNYSGGMLVSADYYFYVSRMDREPGRYRAVAQGSYGFTDYFVIGPVPPILSDLPDQTVLVNDNADNAIDLWAHTYDADSADSELTFMIDNAPDPGAGVSIDGNRYIDINPAADWTGQTVVIILVIDPSGLLDTGSFTVTVRGPISKTWNGSASSDWNIAGNWTPAGVPLSVDDVIIADVTTTPVIPSSGVAVNNLTVNRGAVLDLTDRTLTVEGALINNGTLKQTQDVVGTNVAQFLRVTNQTGDRTKYHGVVITPFGPCYAQVSNTPGITYTTVQAAVDAADEGDTVKVTGYCSGVNGRPRNDVTTTDVVTQVVYISKTVTIRGGYTTAFADPPDPEANPTTLDAGGQGRVLYITGDVSPTIEGLRITGGDVAGLGGGVYVITATATISNNRVFGNSAGSGGGLYLFSSAATLDGNTIISNTAQQGGGLYLYSSDATLINNVVADNQSRAAGSGLYIKGSIPRLLHTTIARNSGGDGSGVYVTDAYGSYSTVALTNTILVGHTVGITVTAGSTATLEATLWGSGVWANEDDCGGEGYITGFYNNIKGPEYSIATLNAVNTKVAAELFIVHDRWSISHGNLPLVPGSYASMPDLVVERIIARSNAMTVIIRNQGNAPVPVNDAFWVDVYIDPAPVPTAVNQTWDLLCEEGLIWGVTEPALPLVPGEAVTLTVDDAYYWSNYSQISWPLLAGTPVYAQADSANVVTNYGAVLESDEIAGDAHGDPAFVNPDAGDYHIGVGSVAIDTGVDAGVSTDIDGDGRPQGTAPDLGADEYEGTYTPTTSVSVTVSVSGNQFCAGRTTGVKRCFDVDPAAALDASVRFYFSEGERNCLALDDLLVFHYKAGWTEEPGAYTRGGTGDAQYVQVQDVAVLEQGALFALDSLEGGGCLPVYLPLVVKN